MAFEDGVFATFYDDAVHNEYKSKKAGYPVFDEVVMIKIQVPNQNDCVPRPMQERDKQRFPKSWQAYVTGREEADDGTPIAQWPEITVGERKICEANQIKTVEQLAEVADSGIHRLGPGGHGLKTRAQRYLKNRDYVKEFREARQEADQYKLRVEELEARLEALEGNKKPEQAEKPARRRLQVGA